MGFVKLESSSTPLVFLPSFRDDKCGHWLRLQDSMNRPGDENPAEVKCTIARKLGGGAPPSQEPWRVGE